MLTELDHCILGIIWRGQPMTAYAVRSHLAQSTTPTWSASTGTVYPSIGRLTKAGLVTASAPSGPRSSVLLTVGPAGKTVLERWLTYIDAGIGMPSPDPIRTRMHFLEALPARQRTKTLKSYQDATRNAVEELEARAKNNAASRVDLSERIGMLGAIAELKARLGWLLEVERLMTLEPD